MEDSEEKALRRQWTEVNRLAIARNEAIDLAAITGTEPKKRGVGFWPYEGGLVLAESGGGDEEFVYVEDALDPLIHNDKVK